MKEIGTFEVTCGNIRVTDPCYDITTWCSGYFPAKNGKYKAFLEYSDEGDWGVRVSAIEIRHENHPSVLPTEKLSIDVGVDSGQAGFFDADSYAKNQGGEYDEPDTFYGKVCKLTRFQTDESKDYKRDPVDGDRRMYIGPRLDGGGVLEYGAVSSSGFGDGGYDCFVGRDDKGEIVSAKVVFIDDSLEDDLAEDFGDDSEDDE